MYFYKLLLHFTWMNDIEKKVALKLWQSLPTMLALWYHTWLLDLWQEFIDCKFVTVTLCNKELFSWLWLSQLLLHSCDFGPQVKEAWRKRICTKWNLDVLFFGSRGINCPASRFKMHVLWMISDWLNNAAKSSGFCRFQWTPLSF